MRIHVRWYARGVTVIQPGVLWYYARGDDRLGPVPEQDLRALLTAGAVPPDALVWAVGMADWQPAQVTAAFSGSAHVPPLPLPTPSPVSLPHVATPVSTPPEPIPTPTRTPTPTPTPTPAPAPTPELAAVAVPVSGGRASIPTPRPLTAPSAWSEHRAGAWRRYGARMLDLVWFSWVFWLGAGVAFPSSTFVTELGGNAVAAAMIVILVVIPVLAWSTSRFGTTPGKAVLGLRVRRAVHSDALDFGLAIRREAEAAKWMALGFPLIALFTMAAQHKRVTRDHHTSYDPPLGVVVEARDLTVPQQIGATLALVVTTAIVIALRVSENVP